jgi:HEAT repeat protein
LVETGDPRTVPTLLAALERFSGSERMQEMLIGLLSLAGDPSLLDRFVRWIVEDGREVAARGLVELDGASASVPRLLEALEQSSNEKQVSAASMALMMMEDRTIVPQVVPVLERLTSTATVAEARLVPVLTLAWKYPEVGNRAALLRLLKREDVRVREAAVVALAAMNDPAAIDAVVELAGHQGWEEVRLERLAYALWDMRSLPVQEQLVEAFRKATGLTWRRLAIVLAKRRNPVLVDEFARFLDDENREVRAIAAEGIALVMWPQTEKPMRKGDWDESYIGPVRQVLCWMLRNEKPRPDDWLIAEELLPQKKKSAVLAVIGSDPVRYLLFNTGAGTLEALPADEAAKWSRAAWGVGMGPAGTGDHTVGQLMCCEGQGFLLVRVMIPTIGVQSKDNGIGIYLFRKMKEGFAPVAPLTGQMRPDSGLRGGDQSSVGGR